MSMDGPADGPVVTLHVGTPKSGTTFLQRELSRNRAALRQAGLLYPGTNPSHFIEAMSLRERGFRGHQYDAAEGAWDRLAAEAAGFDGPVLVSHEMIGGSDRSVIRRAVDSFPGRRVQVVVTCRDLGRQLPAVWQEGVKNGNTDAYADFLAQGLDGWAGTSSRKGVWNGQNLAALGRRWGLVVGNENVVFVTVPPPGAGTEDLWRRFAEAVGLPEIDYGVREKPGNPSMGTVETELLRRLTTRLPDDLPWPRHSRQVKRRFAQNRLVKHHTGGSLTVPEAWRARTGEIVEEMVGEIRDGGYRVIGDLDDLRPHYKDGTDPDAVGEDQLLSLALDLLVPLVLADEPRPKRRPPERPADQGAPATPTGPGRAVARARGLAGRAVRRLRG